MPGKWVRWFAQDDKATDDSIASMLSDARAVLDGADSFLVKRLQTWLEEQANAPAPIGDHMTMVVAATRSNTMREIMRHIRSEIDRARGVLESTREE